MKRQAFVKIGMILVFAGIGVTGFTQPAKDSLFNYMEIAAKNNPALSQKFSEYQAALQKVPQVGSLPDPELTFGFFIRPMELIGGRQLADFRLMQMFPWFGTLKSGKDEMSLMARAKYEEFVEAKLDLFFQVQQTWYELLRNQEEARITSANLELLHSVERIAMAGYKSAKENGTGLADLLRIQIEISDVEDHDSTLQNDRRTLTAMFNALLNRPPEMPLSLADTLVPVAMDFVLPAWSDSVFYSNPMLTMLDYRKQSFDAQKLTATKMGLPMLGVGLDYSLIQKSDMSTSEMNGKDMIMPMVTVTLPIYRKKYKAMQTEAELMKTAAEQGYAATINALRADYYAKFQAMQDAQRRITLYSEQKELAKKTLNILVKSFSANGTGLTEIIQLEQNILNYSSRQYEAISDYNIAMAGIKKILAMNRDS